MSEAGKDRRALYLRWRPVSFADVVGQEHVVRTLRNAVRAGAPAHAYLFAGPRGTGKTSLARILYRAVNCADSRDGNPCGACSSCRAALDSPTLDLIEIDAASNRGIEDIRDLREKVAFAPSEVRYRVYIVDEAHELTGPAWDAFLKTLEEPPPHAIFVLATTEAHRIPGTIVSRCQRFDFRRIRPDDIRARLLEIAAEERLALEPAAAERLARLARGGLRDAISLLDQSASFTAGQVDLASLREALGLADVVQVQRLAEAIARQDAPTALEGLVVAAEAGADLRLLADELARQLRGLLYTTAGAARVLAGEYGPDELEWFATESPSWQPGVIPRLLGAIGDGLTRIRDSGQFQLQLELAVLAACSGVAEEEQAPAGVAAVAVPPIARPSAHASRDPAPGPEPPAGSPPPPNEAPRIVDRAAATAVAQLEPVAHTPDETPVLAPAAAAGHLDLEAARGLWPRVMEWVANRSLLVHSYLQPAELAAVDGDWLVLRFAFKLHYDRVSDAKNRDFIEQGCAAHFGRPIKLRCEFGAPPSAEPDPEINLDDPVLHFALERFGGRAEVLDR